MVGLRDGCGGIGSGVLLKGQIAIRRRSLRQRREMVEHPFGTIKARMGATHFLMKTLKRVRTEMALHVLAYNLTRVMNIFGIAPLIAAMRA
jgi:Transposase DDE domain